MSTHTRDELEAAINEAQDDMPSFYKKNFINWKGKTTLPYPEYHTELIAGWILINFNKISANTIQTVTRSSSYFISDHDGSKYSSNAVRSEEHIAMAVKRNNYIKNIGFILDYQTPLKNSQDDGCGKIDVLSFDDTSGIMRILELKKPESEETLLRCVLEAHTYLMTVDVPKLVNDFRTDGNFNLSNFKAARACPLVFKNSLQYIEYEQMLNGDRPRLRELMRRLDIDLFLLEETTPSINGQSPQYSAKKLPF